MDDSHKLYYSISEVSGLLKLNPSHIRFWEKEFPTFVKPKKNRNGKRMFTLEDIEILKQLLFLTKEKGYTIDGARKILLSEKKQLTKEIEIKNKLEKVREFLVQLKKDLQE